MRHDMRPRISTILLLVMAAGFRSLAHASDPHQDVLQAERTRIQAISRTSQATVAVFSPDGAGGGSAVVISADGYALTNFHVVQPIGIYLQCGLPNGELYDAVVVGIDPTGDVALIKLLGRDDFPVAEMGDSDLLLVGQVCYVIGNPFLLATDFAPTVTQGIISGIHRYQYPAGTLLEYADCIQTDASINPGNSGGPLFNFEGKLVGINGRGSFEKRGRVNVGVGYAISINQIKKFLGYLKSGRIVDHATLGATVSTDDDGGVVVTNILDTSDAYRRGLRYDDQIVEVDGRRVFTANEFKNILGTFPRGWRIPLVLARDEQELKLHVRLAGVHSPSKLFDMVTAEPKQPPADKRPERPEKPKEEQRHPKVKQDQQPIPEAVTRQYENRRGYANYYFNKQNVNRVWESWQNQLGPGMSGAWQLQGRDENEGNFSIQLNDQQSLAELSSGDWEVDAERELDSQLVPPGSGGLLPALHLWRQLATVGPDRFGDVSYLGTAPVVGRDDLADVLVAIRGAIESRFYFDTASGQLLLMELFPDSETDPCELYFHEYELKDDRMIPRLIHVILGDASYVKLTVEQLEVVDSSESVDPGN